MYKIDLLTFRIITATKKEAFNILLEMLDHSESSFASYMDIDIETLEEPPQWALNYLADVLNIELEHLGYQIKDLKATGLKVPYDNAQDKLQELIEKGIVDIDLPIEIKSSIITEAGAIKSRLLINAENILKRFLV